MSGEEEGERGKVQGEGSKVEGSAKGLPRLIYLSGLQTDVVLCRWKV